MLGVSQNEKGPESATRALQKIKKSLIKELGGLLELEGKPELVGPCAIPMMVEQLRANRHQLLGFITQISTFCPLAPVSLGCKFIGGVCEENQ